MTATGAVVYIAKNFKTISQSVENVEANISDSCNNLNRTANVATELATNANERVRSLGNGWAGRAFFGSQE